MHCFPQFQWSAFLESLEAVSSSQSKNTKLGSCQSRLSQNAIILRPFPGTISWHCLPCISLWSKSIPFHSSTFPWSFDPSKPSKIRSILGFVIFSVFRSFRSSQPPSPQENTRIQPEDIVRVLGTCWGVPISAVLDLWFSPSPWNFRQLDYRGAKNIQKQDNLCPSPLSSWSTCFPGVQEDLLASWWHDSWCA